MQLRDKNTMTFSTALGLLFALKNNPIFNWLLQKQFKEQHYLNGLGLFWKYRCEYISETGGRTI